MSKVYISSANTFTLTKSLFAQISAYADLRGKTLSKICVESFENLLHDDKEFFRFKIAPRAVHLFAPAPIRDRSIAYVYPRRYKTETGGNRMRDGINELAKHHKMSTSQLIRIALYLATKECADPDHKDEVMRDMWI